MSFTFIELDGFSKYRENLLDDDSFREMQEKLIENPELGDVISGTGGFRKMRWKLSGTGKSGGVRVIYYNITTEGRLYLALIYAKGQRDNLTKAQRNGLKKIVSKLK